MTSKYLSAAALLIASLMSSPIVTASEAERNKGIAEACKSSATQYRGGNGQTRPMCQQAIYYQCLADDLCDFYPDKCSSMRGNASLACDNINGMGRNDCPPC